MPSNFEINVSARPVQFSLCWQIYTALSSADVSKLYASLFTKWQLYQLQHKCPNYMVDHSHACTNHCWRQIKWSAGVTPLICAPTTYTGYSLKHHQVLLPNDLMCPVMSRYTSATIVTVTTLQWNNVDAHHDSTRPVCNDPSSIHCICVCICPLIEPVVSALMLQSCPLCSAIKLSTLLCDQPVNTL